MSITKTQRDSVYRQRHAPAGRAERSRLYDKTAKHRSNRLRCSNCWQSQRIKYDKNGNIKNHGTKLKITEQ